MKENNNIKDDSNQQSALDLPFNEQVHIILQSHDVGQTDNEYEKTRITDDGFARIYASDLVIVIQPEEEVMHISTLNGYPAETFTHDFAEWDNFDSETFPYMEIHYMWWLDHLRKALFDIIEILERADDDIQDDVIEDANAIIVDLRLKLSRTENHLKHWKERAELRERERDASRLEYGKLITKHQGLEEEHHELNEKYINHSSVYEHKIEQQEEQISKLTDRLKIYQAAYEQEFLKSIQPLTKGDAI